MDYIAAKQAAERWGISLRRVQKLCSEGRIPSVERVGRDWLIPRDAEKPADARRRANAAQ